jgi:hypothetical protein
MSRRLHRPTPIVTSEIVRVLSEAGVVLRSGAGRVAACACGWISSTPPTLDDDLVEREWIEHEASSPQKWISRRPTPAGLIEPSSTL